MINKLYKYNQFNTIKTSLDIGEITPIYWNRLYPGEKIEKFGFKNLTRMITPIYPTLDNAKFDIYAFAVPLRQIYGDYYNDKFFTETTFDISEGGLVNNYDFVDFKHVLEYYFLKERDKIIGSHAQDSTDNQKKLEVIAHVLDSLSKLNYNATPYKNNIFIDMPAVSSGEKAFLSRKFGFDLSTAKTGLGSPVNSNFVLTYWFAYWKIYNDFFKNKKLEKFDYQSFIAALTKDFYGRPVDQFSGDFEDVLRRLDLDLLKNYDLLKSKTGEELIDYFANNIRLKFLQAASFLNRLAIGNTDNDFINSFTFEKIDVDLKQNWNDFKKHLSKEYIKNNKVLKGINNGTVKDVLIKLWNSDNGDRTSVKLLGYDRFEQTIQNVINQSAGSNSQPLGDVGGMSLTFNEGYLIDEFEAKEETIIMVLAVPKYEIIFSNVIDPYEFKDNGLGYNPFMEYVQDSLTLADIDTNLLTRQDKFEANQIVGYVAPFDYLRNKKNIVAGDIVDKWSNWAYVVENPFLRENGITLKHLKIDKLPFKKTLVSSNQDAFISDFGFFGDFYRTIKPKAMIEQEVLEGK